MNIVELEDALQGKGLKARQLHALWEQGQPEERTGSKAASVAWLREDPALARELTKRALELEEHLLVIDVAREALQFFEQASDAQRRALVFVHKDYAEALTRLGQTEKARKVLEVCAGENFQPRLGRRLRMEIELQLGKIRREESHQAFSPEERRSAAVRALQHFNAALALAQSNEFEPLMLSAGACAVAGRENSGLREEGEAKARQLLENVAAVEDYTGPAFDCCVARGFGQIILGRIDAAADSFAELRGFPEEPVLRLADIRYWATRLIEAGEWDATPIRSAFPPLELVVFAGHRTDRMGAPRGFPLENVERVQALLTARLDALNARVGLCGANAGGDLLFAEALLNRGGALHVVLPWPKEQFVESKLKDYEAPGDDRWARILKRVETEAKTFRELGQAYKAESTVASEYSMEVMAGLALHLARITKLDIRPLVLWDGKELGRNGGTSSFVELWERDLQRRPDPVPLPKAPDGGSGTRGPKRRERGALRQEIRSMLFADICGYSQLQEDVIPKFIESFKARVSQLVASSRFAPESIDTWGDAIHAIFKTPCEAARFALALTQMMRDCSGIWLEEGLCWEERVDGILKKVPLTIRIGLHTGPVFPILEPITRRPGFTGAHVTRAARIEPKAARGEIYASEEFAALSELHAELEGLQRAMPNLGYVCEYAGSMRLAKEYPGRHRIYRLLPHLAVDWEAWAEAVHEAYIQEQRKQGNPPVAKPTMRPWSELSEDTRKSNLAQVLHIPAKLRGIGYELAPADGIPASAMPVSSEDLERLAREEHDRWMREREAEGWKYAPERDDSKQEHPSMLPWTDLPETEREKDRAAITNIIRLIDRSGFRVRKVERAG